MSRWILIAIAVIVAALAASQIAIPAIAAGEVEDRLTEGGGEAEVSIDAVPAARLLFGDGDSFEVTASGLDLDLDERVEVFERLDGFGEVDLSIADFVAGPFELESFELRRRAPAPYSLVSLGRTTAADLVAYGAGSLGLPGGPLAALAVGDEPIPIELEMELASDDGAIEVVSGGGTIAGFDAGPLARLITSAILVRL